MYLEIVIQRYDIDVLLKSAKALETEFLLKGMEDQAQDVRKQVRLCWRAYMQVEEFIERVNKLLN